MCPHTKKGGLAQQACKVPRQQVFKPLNSTLKEQLERTAALLNFRQDCSLDYKQKDADLKSYSVTSFSRGQSISMLLQVFFVKSKQLLLLYPHTDPTPTDEITFKLKTKHPWLKPPNFPVTTILAVKLSTEDCSF